MFKRLHLKRVSIVFLLCMLSGAYSGAAAFAADSPALKIVYTGSVRGIVEPCHT